MTASLVALRRSLHQCPELSGQEVHTAEKICSFLEPTKPDRLLTNIGGHGVAAVYQFSEDGPTIAIRCELDALPIQENLNIPYASSVAGVSHKCGHDGHMAIVAGLGIWLATKPLKHGKVVLLFQPAEETGKGGEAVLKDVQLEELEIDYIFALHNIPGVPLGEVMIMEHGFSAEVISLAIRIKGRAAHAAEPHKGVNPATCIGNLISAFASLNHNVPSDADFRLLTPIHILMGDQSYGISPGDGELHYTIRTWTGKEMSSLRASIEKMVKQYCDQDQLTYDIGWLEYFPASHNHLESLEILKQVCKEHKFDHTYAEHPFKFGEDFGWFSDEFKTCMFGLGAGKSIPALHDPDYNFPDDLIQHGIEIFKSILIKKLD